MADLVAFLRARLDEDYETAYGAAESPWKVGDWQREQKYAADILDRLDGVVAHSFHGGTTGHIERFNPTRMLAEVQAKRAIADLGPSTCSAYFPDSGHYPADGWPGYCDGCSSADTADSLWRHTLTLLALPYADHPDYLQEWRP